MTEFRQRDFLRVNSYGSSHGHGRSVFNEGLIVQVVEVSPNGHLVKVRSSSMQPEHLEAWWDVKRFDLYKAALPVLPRPMTRREIARKYLDSAELRHVNRDNTPADLAALGILSLLLDEPERVTDTTGREVTARDMAIRIDELQKQVADLTENKDILLSEMAVGKARERKLRDDNQTLKLDIASVKADKRAAVEEVARLNREQGIVPTREEAVAGIEGFTVTEDGNSVEISDGDDTITFERPIDFRSESFIFAADIPDDGVYITRAQWDALTRQGEAWAKEHKDG